MTVEIPEDWQEEPGLVSKLVFDQLVGDLEWYKEVLPALEQKSDNNSRLLAAIFRQRLSNRQEELRRREKSQTKAEEKPKPKPETKPKTKPKTKRFFPREVIDRIKQRAKVLDYFSRRFGPPIRQGPNYVAICPLHQERNPSFTIYPHTNSFYCFGCGVGGDVIALVRELDGLTFVEAIEQLAPMAGVNISPMKKKGTEVVTSTPTSTPTSKSRRVTFVDLGGGSIAEMTYDPATNEGAFVVRESDGDLKKVKKVVSTDGRTYLPMTGDLIEKGVILLPTDAQPYGSGGELIQTIRRFIHRYVEVPPVFETLCSYYVVLAWLYDQVPVVPYLRALGDYGTGKTRLLCTVGSLCYTPIFVAGSVTAAPIFRILEVVRGTLIIDEADFRMSEAWADIIKILNCGYEKGFSVLRCEPTGQTFDVKAYDVYGPKVIASRKPWKDEALESRCLTNRMHGLGRGDIPLLLPRSFWQEAAEIRNQLLFFRLHNYGEIEIESSDYSLAVEPRLAEIYLPLKSMIVDPEAQRQIDQFIREYHRKMVSARGTSLEATVLEAIVELRNERRPLTVKEVTGRANTKLRDEAAEEDAYQLTTHKTGQLVRNSLGLETRRGTGGRYQVVVKGEEALSRLGKRYGLETGQTSGPEKEEFDDGLSFGPLA